MHCLLSDAGIEAFGLGRISTSMMAAFTKLFKEHSSVTNQLALAQYDYLRLVHKLVKLKTSRNAEPAQDSTLQTERSGSTCPDVNEDNI